MKIIVAIAARDEIQDDLAATLTAMGEADEVILVDDGSIEPIKGANHRFVEAVGPAQAKERAVRLAMARGADVVVVCDSHVRPPAGWRGVVESQVQVWPNMVLGATICGWGGGEPVVHGATVHGRGPRWLKEKPLDGRLEAPMGAFVVLPRAVLEVVGGYAAGLTGYGGEEWWLGIRAWTLGLGVRLMPLRVAHRFKGTEGAAASHRLRNNARDLAVNWLKGRDTRLLMARTNYGKRAVAKDMVQGRVYKNQWNPERPKVGGGTAELPLYPAVAVRESPARTILVMMPIRGRREEFERNLAACRALESGKHHVRYRVVVDEDDPTYQDDLAGLGVEVHRGVHKNKIEAHNAGIVDKDWDILMLVADDQNPEVRGWDDVIARDMLHCWPDGDGALHYNDGSDQWWTGHKSETLCTQSIMGRRYYERFGFVYWPEYKSFGPDTEFTDVSRKMLRIVHIDRVVFRHNHPEVTGKKDLLFQKNWMDGQGDPKLYDFRKRNGLFFVPKIDLSVVIITTPHRYEYLDQLVEEFNEQRDANPLGKHIELVVVMDDGGMSRGLKRQVGLDRANGTYVCHYDDDDRLPEGWADEVIRLLHATPRVDCVELWGVINKNGTQKKFHHSLEHTDWVNLPDVDVRCPNHCSIILTDHARAAGFRDIQFGEDRDFSMRVLPYLKTMAPCSKVMYDYWPRAKRSVAE